MALFDTLLRSKTQEMDEHIHTNIYKQNDKQKSVLFGLAVVAVAGEQL